MHAFLENNSWIACMRSLWDEWEVQDIAKMHHQLNTRSFEAKYNANSTVMQLGPHLQLLKILYQPTLGQVKVLHWYNSQRGWCRMEGLLGHSVEFGVHRGFKGEIREGGIGPNAAVALVLRLAAWGIERGLCGAALPLASASSMMQCSPSSSCGAPHRRASLTLPFLYYSTATILADLWSLLVLFQIFSSFWAAWDPFNNKSTGPCSSNLWPHFGTSCHTCGHPHLKSLFLNPNLGTTSWDTLCYGERRLLMSGVLPNYTSKRQPSALR